MVVKHSVLHAVFLHFTGGSGVSNVGVLASQGQGSQGQQKMKNCFDYHTLKLANTVKTQKMHKISLGTNEAGWLTT